MRKAQTGDYYQSNLLLPVKGVFHAYSTKKSGDMQKAVYRKKFMMRIDSGGDLVLPEQIHGTNVFLARPKDTGFFPGVDALVAQKISGTPHNSALGVLTADCVPLLFTDIEGTVIAVAHAGWKGTLGGISVNVISRIADLGIKKHNILVSMGPHIGACCYDVPGERATKFLSLNANDPRVAFKREGTWYIDLAYSNRLQLQEAGVSGDHIESDAPCTSCNPEDFYSFRRDTKDTFGEIIGVIGIQ